jgi:ABC-type glycerol-3-phosphate transport system substrate-binding protein
MTDLDYAIRALTQYDAEGAVTMPGMLHLYNYNPMILSLLGHGLSDDTGFSSVPDFTDPQLQEMMTQWAGWENEGIARVVNVITEYAPLRVWYSRLKYITPDEELAMFPGGKVGFHVVGFAVSAGTQYPEEAYALAKFITYQPELMNSFYATPARRSLAGVTVEGDLSNLNTTPEDILPFVQTALETDLSAADQRFSINIVHAINMMNQDNLDANTALQDDEELILSNIDAADARRENLNLYIDNPPLQEVAPGETPLKFGLVSIVAQVPNQDRWETLAADFAATDAEVGNVEVTLRIPFGGFSIEELATDFDCFYLNANVVSGADLSQLRSLDPLLNSDPMFDRNDFVNGVLMQLQRDNLTWALPINIQPMPIWYNTTMFEQAGAIMPYEGWNVADFENTLRTLKVGPDAPTPFEARAYGGNRNHLLSLIAAYGGLPLDYRTHPVTVNLTDEATVNAIRQVLDLAKDGYIDYQSLDGGGNPDIGRPVDVAMFTRLLNLLAFLGYEAPEEDPYRMVMYPQGTDYNAMAYDLGAIYISAKSPHPEACYRLMQAASYDPNLVMEMPARRSIINGPDLAIAQGEQAAAYYVSMDELLQQPDTVIFPTIFQLNFNYEQVIGDYLVSFWLYRAFDRYVVENADLQAELEIAQMFTQDFLNCTADIPEFNPALQQANEHVENFTNCAIQVDPSMEDLFGAGG